MRCNSCGADIPPEFKHSVEANCCAGCGGPIMTDADKELLNELADAINRMPHDSFGIASWLMSNYIFEKIGDAKPVEKFHNKRNAAIQRADDGIDRENLKIAENPTEEFLKRTDSYNQVKKTQAALNKMAKGSSKIAEMAKAIQGVEDPYGDEEATAKKDEEVDVGNLNQEDLKAYKELLKMGGNPFVQVDTAAIGRANVGDESGYEDDDGQLTATEIELSKTEKGREVLRNQRIKKLKARDALEGGGMIRRA